MAVHEHAASCPGEAGSELTQAILRLRGWAVWFLSELGDSAAQAIEVAEPLLADQERVLGAGPPRHPGLPEQSRRRLPGGGPGRRGDPAARADPGRLRAGPRPGPPRHPGLPEQPRRRLPGRGPGRRGDPAARADPGRPRAGPGPGPPRHPGLPEQPRRSPTRTRAGPPRRSRCTSAPSPTASGSWARTTPSTLDSRNNLASAYQAAGRAAEAIPLYERTLADRERVLGPDHPDTLPSRNNLAPPTGGGPGREASHCSSAPSPTASGSSALTTPALCPPGTTWPSPTRGGPGRRGDPLYERTLADRERVRALTTPTP